jgi:hypothetical protein
MQQRNRVTSTARIAADLIDRAHREAGARRAAGDREATATAILTEWCEKGAAAEQRKQRGR